MNNWLVCAILSAIFAGLVAIFGKLGVKDVDSSVATTCRAAIMAAALLLFTGLKGHLSDIPSIGGKTWLFLVLAGVCGAASWLFYFQALKVGNAVQVAPIDRLSIVITLLLAWMFLGEKITAGIACGTILIACGALLVARG